MTETEYQRPRSNIFRTLTLAGLSALTCLTGLYIVREQERHVKTVQSYSGVGEEHFMKYIVTYTDGTKGELKYFYRELGKLEREVREHIGHPYPGVIMPGDVWKVDGNNHPRELVKQAPWEW